MSAAPSKAAAPAEIVLVAAVARNGVIGRDGGLVFHEPEDQRHFRQTTMGCPVVMGRKTWDSLPPRFRPLPGRRNLVLTRQADWTAPGAEAVADLDEALARVAESARVCIIGGAQIYAMALPRATHLVLTEIDAAPEGDAHFPAWNRDAFDEVSRHAAHGADGVQFEFVTYRRR